MFNFTNLEKQQNQSYTPFDPELELDKLKSAPKSERRQIIGEYKEALVNQKTGIAQIISSLQGSIEGDTDLKASELMEIVLRDAAKYRFTDEQINNFQKALNVYEKNHSIVEKYKNQSPEDIFESCFGVKPEGELEIHFRPMAINIICHQDLDFARAQNWGLETPPSEMLEMSDILKLTYANNTVGTAFRQVMNKELNNIITIAKLDKDKKEQDATEVHEEQHQFNALFLPKRKNHPFDDVIEEKRGQEGVNDQIRRLIRYEKESIGLDNMVRDEVLAFYKEGKSADDIFSIITSSRHYDYPRQKAEKLASIPGHLKKCITDYEMRLGDKPVEISTEDIKKMMDEYFQNEYKVDIRKWLDSIKTLEEKTFTRAEIIELLFAFPVAEWPSIARRL